MQSCKNRPLVLCWGGLVILSFVAAGCSTSPSASNGTPAGGEHALPPLTTAEEYNAAVNVPRPVLVDFYADWCGPCRQQAPVLAELAQRYAGQVDFYRVDVDESRELAGQYGIRSIPTLLVYKAGSPQPQRLVGFHSRQQLEAILGPPPGG